MKRCLEKSMLTILTLLALAFSSLSVRPVQAALDTTSFAPKVDFATGANPRKALFDDMDGDGKSEMVILNSDSFSVFRNTSSSGTIDASSFAARVDIPSGYGPSDFEIADIDGDGILDVAKSNQASKAISVYRNTSTVGNISFASGVDFAAGDITTEGLGIGDLDGDGKPEMVAGNYNEGHVSVFQNTSTPGNVSFVGLADFPTNLGPNDTVIADVDGDGKSDMVVASTGSASVFRNTGAVGNISFDTRVDVTTGVSHIEVTDLDGDGRLDLLGPWSASKFTIFRNTSTLGNVSFAARKDFASAPYTGIVTSADFDGDGKKDVVVTYTWKDAPFIFSMFQNTSEVGNLSFASKVDFGTGNNPLTPALGDLDGDGKPDIAIPNWGSSTVSVFLNAYIPPDTTPPDLFIDEPTPVAYTNNLNASFGFSGTDNVTATENLEFWCAMDGREYEPCSSPWDYPGLGEGTHSFTIYAKDEADNRSMEESFAWVVDTTVPSTTSLSRKPPAYTTSRTATFTFTGLDAVSAPEDMSYTCQIDLGPWQDCPLTIAFTSLGIGVHTVRFYSQDQAENADPMVHTYSWTIQSSRARNGGFNSYIGTSRIPARWVRSATFATQDGKDTRYKKEGTASVKIVGNGKSKTLTQTLVLSGKAGDRLSFSFWAKGSSIPIAGICQAQVLLYNGSTLKQTKTIKCSSGTYAVFQKKGLNFNAASAFTKVTIKFTYSKGSGALWLDLVSLLK